MSARISLMYKRSGGCDRLHTCRDCGNTELSEDGKRTNLTCLKHAELTGETVLWRETWMACRYFKERATGRGKRPTAKEPLKGAKDKKRKARKYNEDRNGQLRLF